ncbi:hypothetical protein DYB32_007538 [Aphanomyces invadans]|uniref:valine--tRNA ligase n=1 Tax=Aphanomyces invadans TaxID=157072 RepID=A0A3R6WHY4_9STRA|nr:hypothetical protein DYB32_007538 [Aphanomyces invadans]
MLMRAWHAARRAKGRQFTQTSRSLSSLPDNIKQRVHVDPMASTYDPQAVENGWQAFWETQLVNAKHKNANAPRFTMLLPPPNITGALHIGHALTVTIQDALARYHRMTGHEVLWIPGLDHAGIATQSVVEKQLWKEQKLTRHDVGRTAFLGAPPPFDTTRPETILGDVALAIHPDDPRYLHLHGKHVVHPFTNERLPIVLDGVLVDPALGTGVVKITPAHDANDWACAQRHNLPHVVVMDKQAKMVTPHVPDFHGLDRFDARAAMVAKLHELELYVEKVNQPAMTLEQDEDVLDTWFSAALLPLSALEWPTDDNVPEAIQSMYPLNVMETGADILFFWVARMSMLLAASRSTRCVFARWQCRVRLMNKDVLVWMPLRATANTSERVEAELARLSKRLAKAEKTQAGLHAKVTDAQYTTRVPDEIQAQDAERIETAVVEIASLTESIATLHALRSQLTATMPQ